MNFEFSERLKVLPPYLFVEIDKAKRAAAQKGADIIDLGIGDPDTPTPKFIIDALEKAIDDPKTHRYALDQGCPELRNEIARWFKARYNVSLNPDTEILPLIGSKEGIAHMPLAFVNPGDTVLVPEPCYPPYKSGTIFAGGTVHVMPLREDNNFLPDLKNIKPHTLKRAKMMFINYPNNPTGATCDKNFFKDVLKIAYRENIIVCQDAAYSELAYDGFKAPSLLEMDGGMDIGIEFHSLSKTFNMTGWRIGFACGNAQLIKGLAKVKSNIDSGIFTAIQYAGVAALKSYDEHIRKLRAMYEERRDELVDNLDGLGWDVRKPKATFYVWTRVPGTYSSISFAKKLLDEAGVVVTPGNGFGPSGEGYIRMALTVDKKRIKEAALRIKKIL